jgi:TolA-binding protein
MPPDHTSALITAARQRHELTRAKAIRALRELDRSGAVASFQAVARTANVSRSWLYTQPDIRAEIQRLRDATRHAPKPPIPVTQRATTESMRRRLETLNERIRQLTDDNQRLRRQIAQALGERRAARAPASPNPSGHASTTIQPY